MNFSELCKLNLMQRIFSAVILAPIALFFVWYGGVFALLFITIISFLMMYEWNNLIRGKKMDSYLFASLLVLLCVAEFVYFKPHRDVFVLFILALTGVISLLPRVQPQYKFLWMIRGLFYAASFLVALSYLRLSQNYGFESIVFLLLIVWATDIAAYFVGRKIQGPKLWPSVSPNKTWSGFFGGLIVSCFVAYGFALFFNLPNLMAVTILGLFISLVGQMGDLFESSIKRKFGAKDTSQLIPGHGGVLDRLDSLVFAASAACLIGAYRASLENPAFGFLVW